MQNENKRVTQVIKLKLVTVPLAVMQINKVL